MPLIKDAKFIEDTWTPAPEDDVIPKDCQAVITLNQWRDRNDELRGCNNSLGIRLQSDESPDLIADDLDRFGMVILEFSAFADGRAFSYARLLRERYGFQGELRASGPLIPDQYQFLDRCGFDSVAIPDDADLSVWEKVLQEMTLWYQPTADGRKTIIQKRNDGT